MATAVYIDGFNLYYGLARPLGCKWVDLPSYFRALYPNDDIQRVYFFEARVNGPAHNRQKAYIMALRTVPCMKVIFGRMKDKEFECRVDGCGHTGERKWMGSEEKHTDVRLALTMLDDAYRGSFDRQILATADTDLVPALNMIREVHPKQRLEACIPAIQRYRIWGAKDIAFAAGKARVVDADLFLHHQFHNPIIDSRGNRINRPGLWREAPLNAADTWRENNPDMRLDALPNWLVKLA